MHWLEVLNLDHNKRQIVFKKREFSLWISTLFSCPHFLLWSLKVPFCVWPIKICPESYTLLLKQGTEHQQEDSIMSFKSVWISPYLTFYKCGFHIPLHRASGLHEQISFLLVNLKSNVGIINKDSGYAMSHIHGQVRQLCLLCTTELVLSFDHDIEDITLSKVIG